MPQLTPATEQCLFDDGQPTVAIVTSATGGIYFEELSNKRTTWDGQSFGEVPCCEKHLESGRWTQDGFSVRIIESEECQEKRASAQGFRYGEEAIEDVRSAANAYIASSLKALDDAGEDTSSGDFDQDIEDDCPLHVIAWKDGVWVIADVEKFDDEQIASVGALCKFYSGEWTGYDLGSDLADEFAMYVSDHPGAYIAPPRDTGLNLVGMDKESALAALRDHRAAVKPPTFTTTQTVHAKPLSI